MMVPTRPAADFPDLIAGLLPAGSICTFSGASGVGKTAFAAREIIHALQHGLPIFGHPSTSPTCIGILACDRPWRDHRAWFEKAGCQHLTHWQQHDPALPTPDGLPRIVTRSLRDEEYPWEILRDFRNVHKTFRALVDSLQLPPGALLLVDPISLFIPGRLIDYKDVAIGMGLLDQQLKPLALTTLGVFHVSKQKAGGNDRYLRPQDRILGSNALLGYSETTFYLLSPSEAQKPHYEFGYVAHQLPEASFAFKRDKATGLFVPAAHLDLVQDEEQALAFLPENHEICLARSIWVKRICDALGCDPHQAEALIKRLWRAGRAEKVGRALWRRVKPH